MAQAPNYTEDMVTEIKDLYADGQGMSVEELADKFGKTVNSVRSKLVKEGVYQKPEKPKTVKRQGPSKKEILANLAPHIGQKTCDGLVNAKKDSLVDLLGYFTPSDAD